MFMRTSDERNEHDLLMPPKPSRGGGAISPKARQASPARPRAKRASASVPTLSVPPPATAGKRGQRRQLHRVLMVVRNPRVSDLLLKDDDPGRYSSGGTVHRCHEAESIVSLVRLRAAAQGLSGTRHLGRSHVDVGLQPASLREERCLCRSADWIGGWRWWILRQSDYWELRQRYAALFRMGQASRAHAREEHIGVPQRWRAQRDLVFAPALVPIGWELPPPLPRLCPPSRLAQYDRHAV